MHQIEIRLTDQDAAPFYAAFWTYLGEAEGCDEKSVLSLVSRKAHGGQSCVLHFAGPAGIDAFAAHWPPPNTQSLAG